MAEENTAKETAQEKHQAPKSRNTSDPFKALDDKLKFYLTEILTLKNIRKEQHQTISDLRDENFKLKKELERLKGGAGKSFDISDSDI